MERIVLAYSGGLDTSVAIPWLAEQYGAQIVAVTMDLGQGKELKDVRERALGLGAVRAHVLDLREEFARDFILPALQAGAIYEEGYPLATALGRPLIAEARRDRRDRGRHRHGARLHRQGERPGPARRRRARLSPNRGDRAGPRLGHDAARGDRIRPPARHPGAGHRRQPYSTDGNLWGRSIECGVLEDPWREPPEDIYTLTKSPAAGPDVPAYVEIAFERGMPVAINGVACRSSSSIERLSAIAGKHGVGRIDHIENRLVGIKSREIYEAPAAVVLHEAHRELETLIPSRDLERMKRGSARGTPT